MFSSLKRYVSAIIIIVFTSTNSCYGLDTSSLLNSQDISTDYRFGAKPLTPEGEAAQQVTSYSISFTALAEEIAKYYLGDVKGVKNAAGLRKVLREGFNVEESEQAIRLLEGQVFDLNDIKIENGIVSIKFEEKFKLKEALICKTSELYAYPAKDMTWSTIGEYSISIREYQEKGANGEKDFKGTYAPSTDPEILELIKRGQVVEVYPDSQTGHLKANRIKLTKDYAPIRTPADIYRGQDVDLRQLFTEKEIAKLENWIRSNYVRGSPVKFRVIMGDIALGWRDDVDHSIIGHAAVRDKAIYIGSLLLSEALKEENNSLWHSIIEEDELRHLRGLDHGDENAYKDRLNKVAGVVKDAQLVEIRQAMMNRDVYFIKGLLEKHISQNDTKSLLKTIFIANNSALSLYTAPLESRYPFKQAVALLSRDEQNKLLNALESEEAKEYRNLILVDEIFLMLVDNEFEYLKDWIKNNAANLEGRSIWEVSPEIWHEAGGLARVMQYHGAEMRALISESNIRFRQLEPHYQNRIDAFGNASPFDYRKDITHPIQSLEEVDSFYVNVGGREVKVVVSRGINDLGIEVYLIRDIQDDGTSYYTHSLYNYSDASPWGNHANIPTWEEFSVFYSKAALKFIERQENKERKTDLKWKAPVVHLNDSQVALVSVYAKIELDKEIEKAEKDNSYIVNPVLDDMVMCFTTHTYANRKEYSLEGGANDYSEGIMSFMDIPSKYRGLFVNYKQGGYRYDMASGGLRTADWQGAVARAHRDDVAIWDEWINDPYNDIANQLKAQVNGYDIEVNVTAVSNGDHRALTARYFRDILNKLFGSQVDVEQPTGEQIFGEKREAKKQLKLAKGTFYSTHDFEVDEEGMCTILDPNQMVITYSGRGVPEKVGMGMDFREYIVTGTDGRGAFDHYAIEEALKRGAQIVLYANVQTKHELSRRIQKDMIKFIDDMRSMKYPGRCIFVPRFSQDDQRKLLAASDVQVQDSYPKSEAAGFTECDMADCGGIEVCTLRTDNNGVGEGLLQAQGMLMDLGRLGELSIEELDQLTDEQILEYLGDAPGRGNTILPKELSAKGYLHAYVILLKIYQVKQLKAYQATSVRLSRVLDARLTSAEYLRQFSYAVSRKETKKKIGEKIKELEDMQRARKTLLAQLFTNQKDEPRGYAIRNIAKDVLYGQIESALMLFFTSASFQGADENLSTVAEIFDKLIEAYKGDKATGEYIIRFLKAVIAQSVNMAEEDENQKKVSQNLQVLAGQTLTIISWMKDGVPEAENMRVSAEENKMIANDKYGKGFISIDTNALPVGLSHTQKEGKIGLFWRGIEKIKKLADNICKLLMIDDNIFKKAKEKVVMYLMDHGFIKVPHGLRKATDDGDVSTIHYTAFINDKLPGFVQTTSTGAGHFQADKLDIKYVPEGKGIQVCVRYDMSGNIVDKKCFEVEAGDWCVALPGYVDYFINKGGLRFYDFSIKLSPEMAKKFNPHMDFTPENIAAMKKVVEEHARAPYLGALIGGQSFIVKTRPEDDNNTEWLSLTEEILPELAANYSLVKIYAEQLTSMEKLNAFVEGFADAYNKSLVSPKKGPSSPLIIEDEAKKMIDSEQPVPDKGYMDKVEGVLAFLDDNGTFIKELFDEKTGQDKLIRVSVESISSIGKENVVGFLQAIQTGRGYVELFSTENPGEISENVYKNMGLVKKALPASLQEGNRSKSNTITIFPVFKGESLPESLVNARWGVVKPGETIIAPVGFNYDAAGLARSVMLGFRLSEIARKNLDSDSHFVEYTLAQYMDLCLSQGETAENFDLTKEDIVNIALGNIDVMVRSLNKLIRLLPIMPINVEQLHEIYERAREIAIRA